MSLKFAAALAACGGSDTTSLEPVEWTASSLGGEAILDGTELTLRFGDDNELAGFAGCNRFRGGYRRDADVLYVTALALTRMHCAQPDGVMAQEKRYVSALQSAYRVEESAGTLTITPEDDQPGIVFRRAAGSP